MELLRERLGGLLALDQPRLLVAAAVILVFSVGYILYATAVLPLESYQRPNDRWFSRNGG